MNTTITDVFFDLDHTLWDFEKNSNLAFETIFKQHQITLDYNAFYKNYVPINSKFWEMYRKDEITQEQLRYGRLKEVFDSVQYQIEDDKILILSDEYINYLPTFNHLFDGAIDILDYLKPKYKLHIITNGFDKIQKIKIDNSNIAPYFQTVTNSEMAGVKKPNPIIFEHALNLAQAKKENSIMIGDCIDADVRGALNAGFDAVFFTEKSEIADKNIKQIKHLLELKKYL